ncbi:MAG TPA: YfhO family protein, partial [Polyangia bacterium]|nr:YfhO family protein [Polyangia bacterium]
PRRLWHAGRAWVVILAAGCAVAAVQLLPTWEAVTLSQRAGEGVEFAASFSSAPANLLTYVVPHLFGNQADAPFVGSWSYWESLGYLGIAPLLLAAFAVAALPWRRTLPAAAVVALALVLSLGTHTPLFEPWVKLVPGADLFRSPGRFCLVATLLVSLLAAQGLDAWLGELARRRRLVATAAAVACALALVVASLALRPDSADDHVALVTAVDPASKVGEQAAASAATALVPLARSSAGTSAVLAALAGVLLLLGLRRNARWRRAGGIAVLVLLAVDLHLFGHGFLTTAPADRFRWPAAVEDLLRSRPPGTRIVTTPDLRAPNRGAALGASDVGGYDILMDATYGRYLNRAAGRDPDRFVAFARIKRWSPALDRLGASLLLSGTPMNGGRSQYAQGFGAFEPWRKIGGLYLYRHPDPAPRAVLVHRTETYRDEAAAFERLADTAFDLRKVALVETAVTGLGAPFPGDLATIEVYEPNRVEIRVIAGEPGLLVLSDNPWPGWSAAVDGAPAEILRANLVMRAVRVPAGKHLVEFRFLPTTFVIGGAISLLSVLALIAAFVWTRRRSRG